MEEAAFADEMSALYAASAARELSRPASKNPYALQLDTLKFLAELADRVRPKAILEFGCGESTHIFADWAAANGSRLISVENDRNWVEQTRASVAGPAAARIELLHLPLHLKRLGLRLFFTYPTQDPTLAAAVRECPLILIDGPHLSGREAVLYFVLNNCTAGTTIVVDDWALQPVREMVALLAARLSGTLAQFAIVSNTHGLCILRTLGTVRPGIPPAVSPLAMARSIWRCYLDWKRYGTGR